MSRRTKKKPGAGFLATVFDSVLPRKGLLALSAGFLAMSLDAAAHAVRAAQPAPTVAATFRYVRDGAPVDLATAEGLRPTQLFVEHLSAAGLDALNLSEFAGQFQELVFKEICAIEGADRDCTAKLNYAEAVVRIVGAVRDRGAGAYAPHLKPMEACNGVVVVGEVRTGPAPTRNTIFIDLDFVAKDYRTLQDVIAFSDRIPVQIAAHTGGRARTEIKRINEFLHLGASALAEKIEKAGQYRICGGG